MEHRHHKAGRRPEPAVARPAVPVEELASVVAADPHPARAGGLDGGGGMARLPWSDRTAGLARIAAVVALQRTHGNARVQQMLQPLAVHRQPGPGQSPPLNGTHTITDPQAAIRDGPDDFKSTGKNFAVGTRVEVVATKTTAKGTYVELVEPGTRNALGWTAQTNLGAVQYAKAAASYVYVAKVKPRKGFPDTLPVMVYLPPNFTGKNKADVVLYFHGDAADYSADTANNYDRENPAIGMNLPGVAAGADRLVIAPQGNAWRPNGVAINNKSPWDTLQAGDYESIVQTVFTNLQADLKLQAAIPRGAFSIAGHSGGGKALGQATKDLAKTDGGVKDVTLVEAGYGGGEFKGKTEESFAKSFQMVRDWLLDGAPGKVLRVITIDSSPGIKTRHAIENRKDDSKGRVPVLGLEGVKQAIKAKGRDAELQAVATEVATDPQKRGGGMRLIRTIVVSRTDDGTTQGTIYVFLMADPPRAKGVDKHFGTRNATIGSIISGQGKGDDFAKP